MQIEINRKNELAIIGNIKTVADSVDIINAIKGLQNTGAKNIQFRIKDSFSMTSTVIGHLMKLVNIDKIPISLVLGDHRLYKLLDELSLVQPFNVHPLGTE